MVAAEIKDITVIVGYQRQKFKSLLVNYPFLKFVTNDDYVNCNNISSMMKVLDRLDRGTYICEADLYVTNPAIISKYQYDSNILGYYCQETTDWCFKLQAGCVLITGKAIRIVTMNTEFLTGPKKTVPS